MFFAAKIRKNYGFFDLILAEETLAALNLLLADNVENAMHFDKPLHMMHSFRSVLQ